MKKKINEHFISVQVGEKIRRSRIKKGLTGAELGKKLKVSQQQISRYENGITQLTVDLLFEISDILEVKVIELLPLEIEPYIQNGGDKYC